MTASVLISSVLLLLATFIWTSKTESLWITESNAKEEKNPNVLFGNESFRGTFSPVDTSTTLSAVDEVIFAGYNDLWSRRINFTDHELREDTKHETIPENSLERDSLDDVNDFLQENTVTEPSIRMALTEELSPLIASSLFLSNNDSTSPTMEILKRDAVSTTCAYGDRKCGLFRSGSTPELVSKSTTKIAPATFSTLPSVTIRNIVKSLRSQFSLMTERSVMSTTMTRTVNYVTPTINPSESSTARTLENIILIDDTDVDKDDESVIQNQLNKSEKLKPVKHEDRFEEISSERTILKSATSPVDGFTKETVSLPDALSPTSTLFTTTINMTSVSSFLAELEAVSKDSELVTKVHLFGNNVSLSVEKDFEIQSVGFSKIATESSIPSSNQLPTVSWYNAKSNVPPNEDKPSKELAENIPEWTPVLTPSFQHTPTVGTRKMESIASISDVSDLPISSILPTNAFTPVLETESIDRFTVKDDSSEPTVKEVAPPPRLSNPGCSSLPVCVEITLLETSWEQFCSHTYEFRDFLSKSVSPYTRPISHNHIILDAEVCSKHSIRPLQSSPDVTVAFYVTNDSGEYEERLTEICGLILRKGAPTSFRSSVLEVRLYSSESQSTPLPLIPELNSGFVAAVSISAVAGVALCLLCIMLIVMKQKLVQGRSSDATTPTADAYSLDSLSITASFRRRRNRRSARSYLNHAFNDQDIPSHPLNEKSLMNCLRSRDLLEQEFKKIALNMPKLDAIPEGAEVKNRYSNILPSPETRVVLAEPSGDPFKSYINANFVKGYEGKAAFYVACQAPLPEGIEDFWRMVWEQQCRTIVMLTLFEENGSARCATYFPQSTLVSQAPHGDFQVSLVKKEVYEFYTLSTLRLLDLEKNLFRDIAHLWFTGWPDVGVPKDPTSLITFVQQCRPYINCNAGPTVVHCSTGTGRTGVFLALDICMREYEESRSIDILQCVAQLRRDRGGAVQNKDQYILIYEAMLEYASRNQSQCASVCSKVS